MTRIYSTPAPRDHQQGLQIENGFQAQQFRYYYRRLRRAGADKQTARSALWQTAFYAHLYPTAYVNMEGRIP